MISQLCLNLRSSFCYAYIAYILPSWSHCCVMRYVSNTCISQETKVTFAMLLLCLLESNVIQIWMQLSNAEKTIFGRLVQQFYRFDIKDVNQQVTNKYYISNDSEREKEVVDNNDEHRLWAIFSSNGTLKSRKRIMSHLFLTNFDYCIHTSSSRNKHVSYKRRRVLCHISLNLH